MLPDFTAVEPMTEAAAEPDGDVVGAIEAELCTKQLEPPGRQATQLLNAEATEWVEVLARRHWLRWQVAIHLHGNGAAGCSAPVRAPCTVIPLGWTSDGSP